MADIDLLDKYGLFRAKVPRYTSYPPANLFQPDTGRRMQNIWLEQVPENEALSLYLHIPFCRRLCWFCACRTQGTRTLRPVETYIDVLMTEIRSIRAALPASITMARLHLGGGTPTLLSPAMMSRLLATVFQEFTPAEDLDFSVEIDPTEADPNLLTALALFGMNRASIGVQDFAPDVQKAIGRHQSLDQTRAVVDQLRDLGVNSLNLDLLYGLPHQTWDSLHDTLRHVCTLNPDRLALYGYAHVPKMSKRQVMIDATTLPDPRARHDLAQRAHTVLTDHGYTPIGIDHFALPHDSLAQAKTAGTLRRNFQGYTDDTCATLLGLGASAISQFPQGFCQNAVATAAYSERIQQTGRAGHRGLELDPYAHLMSKMIESLMCYGEITLPDLDTVSYLNAGHNQCAAFDPRALLARVQARFPQITTFDGTRFRLDPSARSLTRILAAALDGYDTTGTGHSGAI